LKVYEAYVKSFALGSVTQTITKQAVRNLIINLPSIQIQKKITNFIGSIDDKIELNRKMNQTLEEMAQALFKSWFVDFAPVHAKAEYKSDEELEIIAKELGISKEMLELFPSEFVESEMGMIPLGWEVKIIKDISNVIDCLHSKKPKELDYDSGNILLQLNNIQDTGLLDSKVQYFISDDDYSKWISRIEIVKDDFVITNVGRVGAVSKIPGNFKAAIGRNITAIRAKKDFKYIGYLQTLLTSKVMKSEISKKTDIGTILNALNVKSIPLLRFIYANENVMSAFEKIVSPMHNKRELNQLEIQTLQKTRDALLPKLLSGELDVSEVEVH
jgi:type I restriction enzyme S subunit